MDCELINYSTPSGEKYQRGGHLEAMERGMKEEKKNQACFSISIIVVGFISGIHYRLIGLIRKRHDCITNSTRGCQDGFISIPEPFLEKHLVISVW